MFIYVVLLTTVALTGAVPSSRIVNGDVAGENSWPFKASLNYGGSHICGATLINERVALTAAHCVGGSKDPYQVVLGEHSLNTPSQNEQYIEIDDWLIHPEYDANYIVNDVAILYLKAAAELNDKVDTIDMLETESDYDSNNCMIVGWGKQQGTDSGVSNALMEGHVRTLTPKECRRDLGSLSNYYQSKEHICILGTDQNRPSSACNGDSGGPLVCRRKDDSGWIQVGITSWGIFQCPEGKTSVYARLSTYVGWINDNI